MTEISESVAVPTIAGVAEGKKLVACDWEVCHETHEKKPDYKNDGYVKHNSSYESDRVSTGFEPWKLYGPGNDSKANLSEYLSETLGAKYVKTAAALKYPEYYTQKYHIISINLFENVSNLSHNAKLIGYDVNHKKNNICLSSYTFYIVQHDLQCHRGRPPKALYNDKIDPLLRNLERKYIRSAVKWTL